MANRPPLVKQLLGAFVGGTIALVIYSGYRYSEPMLQTAFLLPRSWFSAMTSVPGALRFTTKEPMEREQQHLMQQALQAQTEIAQQYAAKDAGVAKQAVPSEEPASMPTPPVHRPIPGDIPPGFPDELPTPDVVHTQPVKKLTALTKARTSGKNLPNSGFGLGTVALMALGGAGLRARIRAHRARA